MNKIECIIALLFANNSEEIKGITRFEKLLFYYLKQHEQLNKQINFKFEAYDYGPHSDEIRDLLYALQDKKLITIKTLETDNFLEIDDVEIDEEELKPIDYDKQEIYTITSLGKKIGEKIFQNIEDFESLNKFKKNFNNLPLNRLIQIVYTKYPEMTKKSRILKEVFG